MSGLFGRASFVSRFRRPPRLPMSIPPPLDERPCLPSMPIRTGARVISSLPMLPMSRPLFALSALLEVLLARAERVLEDAGAVRRARAQLSGAAEVVVELVEDRSVVVALDRRLQPGSGPGLLAQCGQQRRDGGPHRRACLLLVGADPLADPGGASVEELVERVGQFSHGSPRRVRGRLVTWLECRRSRPPAHAICIFTSHEAGCRRLGRLDSGDQRLDRWLGVAEQHRGLLGAEERVRDAGEAGAAAALQDDDVLRLVDVEDRHAGDR